MASQPGSTPTLSKMPSPLTLGPTSCPTCGRQISSDELEEIGGRIAAKEREQTLAITAELEKEFGVERARAEAKAKADLESASEGASVRMSATANRRWAWEPWAEMKELFPRIENLHAYVEKNNWYRKIQGTAGESSLPHAMYHGNSENGISAITSALRKGIEASVWTKAA
jgi:hypothetical protein